MKELSGMIMPRARETTNIIKGKSFHINLLTLKHSGAISRTILKDIKGVNYEGQEYENIDKI
jgi:hypothetical protein